MPEFPFDPEKDENEEKLKRKIQLAIKFFKCVKRRFKYPEDPKPNSFIFGKPKKACIEFIP
jgi:hypothetical protein